MSNAWQEFDSERHIRPASETRLVLQAAFAISDFLTARRCVCSELTQPSGKVKGALGWSSPWHPTQEHDSESDVRRWSIDDMKQRGSVPPPVLGCAVDHVTIQ